MRRIPINLEPEGTTNGVFSSNDVPIDNVTDSNYPVDQTVDYTWELFTHLGYNVCFAQCVLYYTTVVYFLFTMVKEAMCNVLELHFNVGQVDNIFYHAH